MTNVNNLPDDLQVGDVVRVVDTGCGDGWTFELVERAPKPEFVVGTTGSVKFSVKSPFKVETHQGIRCKNGYMTVDFSGIPVFVHENNVIEFTPDSENNEEIKRKHRIFRDQEREIDRLAKLVGSRLADISTVLKRD